MSDATSRLNAALEGRYAIERELGEGGMATVYLADDLKHERKVALKVLKPELAAVVGAERFLAEIKTTANLTHPHILPLHDSGEADSFVFYVMPYVEGESLRDKLDREHQLPVDDAVRIASDVAEALGYAHGRGVIHRDIKPANILIQAGRPVIADFGIALAVSAGGADRLTETGLSVGTPHYMSPEQATGDQTTGPATDTYALGCVLYEMLVGEPPYTGSTAQAILGKIIAGELASATKERASVPTNVDEAIRKALEKLPADRFAQAGDFANALADPGFRHAPGHRTDVAAPGEPWKRLSIATGAVAAIAIMLLLGISFASGPDAPAPPPVRFTMPVGRDADARLAAVRPPRTSVAFSPDGEMLVYVVVEPGAPRQLYAHRLDQEGADPIDGTEGGVLPFFSPDGAWIGFWADGSLRRVPAAGGEAQAIALASGSTRGATWGDNGTIVFASGFRLYRVAAAGGEPELLAEPDTPPGQRLRHSQPHMLPGSETVLFHAARSLDPEDAEIVALDLASLTEKTLLTNAMDPRYVETGHLLFVRQGALMAVRFDADRVEVQGQPVVMLEDVMQALFMPGDAQETGAAQVAISAAGHLAYARGGTYPERPQTVVRITPAGDTVDLGLDPREYSNLRLSPEGDRLTFVAGIGVNNQIWVHHLGRGVSEPLNTGGFTNWPIEWSPDGRSLAFASDRDQSFENLYRLLVDRSGEPERLAPSPMERQVLSWSSQGDIAFRQVNDIWILPPDGDPAPFFTSEDFERWAAFSPDGRWLAYASNRSGRNEVYVRPYPGPDPPTLISVDGGVEPAWSPDGRRIYYIQPGEDRVLLMNVEVTPGDPFQVGRPVPLLDTFPRTFMFSPARGYDVMADGSIVLALPRYDADLLQNHGAAELHVILNWFEELRQRTGSN